MTLNRRDVLRWGAVGGAGAVLSAAAGSAVLPSIVYSKPPVPRDPLTPILPPQPALSAPAGINPVLFQKAKAALGSHRIGPRDVIGIVDFSKRSAEERFYVVDLMSGRVDSYRVAHGQGSDPNHNGYLDRFSNEFGSYATSKGTYTTGDYYHGKYGLSMKTHGLDWTNNNAEPRAIVIHNAWYAEPGVIAAHGKLGRSQGCFAFSRADQYPIMKRLAGGRMIYAEKVA